jgi:hypothetical protein
MTTGEHFNFILKKEHEAPQLFDEFHDSFSAKIANVDVQLVTELRKQYPELIVTTVPAHNCDLCM